LDQTSVHPARSKIIFWIEERLLNIGRLDSTKSLKAAGSIAFGSGEILVFSENEKLISGLQERVEEIAGHVAAILSGYGTHA
jgi:hypothetical protein